MANAKTQQDLEEARRVRNEYRLERIRRTAANRADLVDPVVDSAWISDSSDNTLVGPKIVDGDLPVQVPEWDTLPHFDGDAHVLTLLWAAGENPGDDEYNEVGQVTVTAPIPANTFPIAMTVPNARLTPDGHYQLRYEVFTENNETRPSSPVSLICDTTPPWKHVEPGAMDLPIDELTEQYLIDNPGFLTGTLPTYDYQIGDKVATYWLTTPLPSDPNDLPDPVNFAPLGPDRLIVYPPELLRESLDKDYYALYLLYDKAGNRSPISAYKRIDVALGALPDNLQDPVVPLAIDPDQLDLADVREGVTVEIPSFDNHKKTDRIEVTWGSTPLTSTEVGVSPRFPVTVPVPNAVLYAEYDHTLEGVQPINVSYRILRGHKPSDSRAIDILADFSRIGPDPDPDPDWPNPITPLLSPARIFGRSGTPPELDKLIRTDEGQPADLTFDLYDPLNEDEVVDFFWGTEEVTEAVYTITNTDVAGGEVTVEIPWSYIKAGGNAPKFPVHYRIHAPGSDNYQRPVSTEVNVDAITIRPQAPEFKGLSMPNNWLNCGSLFADPAAPLPQEPAVRVAIPDLSAYRADGDTITLVWVAFKRLVSGGPGDEIIGTRKRVDITLGINHPVTGFIWYVEPYDDHLLPTYNPPEHTSGLGQAHYEYLDANNETIFSEVAEAKVGMFDAAGSCPLL